MARPPPLSPHLEIYKLPLTAVLSFSHRLTGVMLVLGLMMIALVLLLAVGWPQGFTSVQQGLISAPGQILFWLFIYALFFHLCHGVRHLLWDSLQGFEAHRQLNIGVFQIGVSIFLTFITYTFGQPDMAL
ncbi:MAG: succinate dehydrogenase, cytochrome b556 subunit [Methylococcaceae bacterium]